MFRFDNKIVLVTGGSRGIGREIAKQFADLGATVAVHYVRNLTAAETTRDSLAGAGHTTVQADMQSPEQVQQAIDTVVKQYGRLDILINNAGVFVTHKIAEASFDDWQAAWKTVIDTNLIGPANACYCAAQQMIKQGGGRIVNVSSRGAFRGEPEAPAYGASKAGLNQMSQSLAKALAPHNIFVGVVAPGFVETEMAKTKLEGESGVQIRSQSPLNRVAMPDEVARAVLFLAAPGTEFMTGAIVDVNGASYLRS